MSYESGYGEKPGEIGYWGNGDGRFLYPPRREPGTVPASLPGCADQLDSLGEPARWHGGL